MDKFAEAQATQWFDAIDSPPDPEKTYKALYVLAQSLEEELSQKQIHKLPIETVVTFLAGEVKGISPHTLIFCFLTSPVSTTSFTTLKEVHNSITPNVEHQPSEVLH